MPAQLSLMRDQLVDRIAEAQEKKQLEKNKITCEHVSKFFRQSIRNTNQLFQGVAYFKVKVCVNCHKKVILEYVVEKGGL